MTTQQAQWREWYRMEFRCEPSDSPQSYAGATKIGWLAAAQKYSPTPEEREYLEACYARHMREHDLLVAVANRLREDWCEDYVQMAKVYLRLHASRQPPRVDQAKRLPEEIRMALFHLCGDDVKCGQLQEVERMILKHLEALEASK